MKIFVFIWLLAVGLATFDAVESSEAEIDEDVADLWTTITRDLDDAVAGQSMNNQASMVFNDEDQCPCVRPPGSTSASDCVVYNPEYQAATLEECIENFKNPLVHPEDATTLDPELVAQFKAAERVDPRVSVGSRRGSASGCSGYRCRLQKGCLQRLIARFYRQAGQEDPESRNLTLRMLNRVVHRYKMKTDNRKFCSEIKNRIYIHKTAATTRLTPDMPELGRTFDREIEDLDSAIRDEVKGGRPCGRDRRLRKKCKRKHKARTRRRHKRSATEELGKSTPVSCSYHRGNVLPDRSGFVALCNRCWSWRMLPHNYFPRYINEVTCDKKDLSCLSGWGECRPILRSVQVMFNTGTITEPNQQQRNVNTNVGCDCQVQSGSLLHNFVSR